MSKTQGGERRVLNSVVERECSQTCPGAYTAKSPNRHVIRTGEIKDFVITEESGIAKGIRRIVAVTGYEAAEVRRVAELLKTRLDQLEAMEGKEKDAGLKAYQVVRADRMNRVVNGSNFSV